MDGYGRCAATYRKTSLSPDMMMMVRAIGSGVFAAIP